MRKIIASAQVSLDGVMQGQGSAQEDTSDGFDLGGWSMKFSDAKAGAAIMGVVGTLDKPTTFCWAARPTTFLQAIGPMFRQTTQLVRSLQKRTNTY
jgi:hypothetical protein